VKGKLKTGATLLLMGSKEEDIPTPMKANEKTQVTIYLCSD
jgi:hypothetical protein